MASRANRSKKAINRPKRAAAATTTTPELQRCIEAQEQLRRTEDLAAKWQEHRRQAVRAAFLAGATTRQIADAIKVSRAKVYRLIGSRRAIQA